MTPPLSEQDLKYIRDQAALLRLAIQQSGGDAVVAAAALFTAGVELSLDCQIDELVLSDRLFSICRDKEDDL
jgi:hypothetical protein